MVKNARSAKEIVVTVINKIGILADMAKLVAEHGINIEAIAGYAEAGSNNAKIMLVTEDNLRVGEALKKSGYKSLNEADVLVVELENKAGALKYLTAQLAQAELDIKQIYGTACSSGCPAKIILSTSNNEKALLTLKK